MNIPYLSADDLDNLQLTTAEVVATIERVIRQAAAGKVWAAPKAVVTPPDQRYMMAALAAMDEPNMLAVKTVVLNPDNPNHGLPQINGLVTILDSVTGLPVAILDGCWITGVRTAGLSATAAKAMANPHASSIGFVGTGLQARTHLQAFAELFPLQQMKMFGRGQANKDLLAADAEALGLQVEDCASGQEVVNRVDLLVTTVTHTGGAAPFLDASGMQPGAFAAVVDLGAPWYRDSFSSLDRVIIDDLQQEASLANKLCAADIITGDLSQLVLGQVSGSKSAAETSAFIFRGHALGDLALAALAMEKYTQLSA